MRPTQEQKATALTSLASSNSSKNTGVCVSLHDANALLHYTCICPTKVILSFDGDIDMRFSNLARSELSVWAPHAIDIWNRHINALIEGSLEVKLPTIWSIWTDGTAEVGKEEDQRRERARRKKMQAREKVEKSRKSARRCGAKHISRSKLTKHLRFGALLEVELLTKLTPLWREAHTEVKMCKAPQCRITFGSWAVDKAHAAVARSTFRSKNVQSASMSNHFWELRCWESAPRCGAKHISKSKV